MFSLLLKDLNFLILFISFGLDPIRTMVSMHGSLTVNIGKTVPPRFLGCFDPIIFILAGNEDMHQSLYVFRIWPNQPTDYIVSCH